MVHGGHQGFHRSTAGKSQELGDSIGACHSGPIDRHGCITEFCASSNYGKLGDSIGVTSAGLYCVLSFLPYFRGENEPPQPLWSDRGYDYQGTVAGQDQSRNIPDCVSYHRLLQLVKNYCHIHFTALL